jgi:hypothetical protein
MKSTTPTLASLAAAFILALTPSAHSQQTATTNPLGFVMVNIAAGTGSAKTGSLVSRPLHSSQNFQTREGTNTIALHSPTLSHW